jgi:hypothetical protein
LDEESSKHAGLAQENGFCWLRIIAQWLVKGATMLCTCKKECNKYNLTLITVSDCPIIMIRPGGLLLVVPHLLAGSVFVLWVGLQKSK